MGMTVSRRKDTRTPRVFIHKIADVRGGVSVATSELGSDYLPEGAVLSAPIEGLCHVVKVANVVAAVDAAATEIKVAKGHQFKVGDFVLTEVGKVGATITAIDTTDKAHDTVTVDTALGAIAINGFIAEAKAKLASKAELKYEPFSVNGTGKPIVPKSNLDTDAWVIGVTKGNDLPDFISGALKGIINY